VINPRVKSAYVEIQGSMMYSIAVDPVVVWCGGACGWYEIRPSAQFEEIYEQMREAIVLYYAILDVFEASAEALEVYRQMPKSQRKRMREPTIDLDEVLLKVDIYPRLPILARAVYIADRLHSMQWLSGMACSVTKQKNDATNGLRS
jgi:hypothetical protein